MAYHRPRYPLPSPHLCRARLRFSRQLQSNIHYHLRQINHWILEPRLQNLQRTLPSDEPENSRRLAQRHLRLFVEDGASTPRWVADLVVNDLQPPSGLARVFCGVSGGVRLRSNHRLFSSTPSPYEDLWLMNSSSPRPLRERIREIRRLLGRVLFRRPGAEAVVWRY
ncbi:hypothetical protein CA85_02110 [Allorhodopirellula solitaria]|uniref:Uncharacterized protein n=1 Tax=Allorhodopirellula solitaria TaxID=2527987 RepID=A0A5C5YJ81_9BACT|nr:hypothetical protein CA85_02110 [Allorhodopirellula solitaria]